jgi:hypothetical protein
VEVLRGFSRGHQRREETQGNLTSTVEHVPYIDQWMDELEKERQELVRQRDEVMKFLSEISLTEEADEEEKEAIRVCYDQMRKCRKMNSDKVQGRGKEKQRRRRNFSEEEQKVLRQYGNKPSEKELKGLTSKLGCERKDILKHFNNRRYQESKRRRVNSELITEDEIDNFLNGLDDCGKKT